MREEASSADSTICLSKSEKVKIVLVCSLIGVATISGFIASTVISRLSVLLAGLGIITYVFGLRHGFDADHMAAIDNTTRKLMQENQRREIVQDTR